MLPEIQKYNVSWCYFPYPNIEPHVIHPVLILQKFEDEEQGTSYVTIAGGSTVNPKYELKEYQFAVFKNDPFYVTDLPGLYNDTNFAFNLSTVIILPYDDEHFAEPYCKKRKIHTSLCGKVPVEDEKYPELKKRFKKCKHYANLDLLMSEAYNNFFN